MEIPRSADKLDPTLVSNSLRDAVREVLTRHDIDGEHKPFNDLFEALRKDAYDESLESNYRATCGDIFGVVMRELNKHGGMTLSHYITPGMKSLFNIEL